MLADPEIAVVERGASSCSPCRIGDINASAAGSLIFLIPLLSHKLLPIRIDLPMENHIVCVLKPW